MEHRNKRDTRKLKKQQQKDSGVTKCKRKRKLCQEDIDELAKDIALIKKLKRKKVRVVKCNCWFKQHFASVIVLELR
jgi:ATP-dependent RNA helicase DDX55/SPB4